MIPVRSDSKARNYTEILKNIVNVLDSLMAIDFSYKAKRKERTRYENNFTLVVNGRRPKPGPMKKQTDCPQAISLNIYDSNSDPLKNVKDWNHNGDVGDGSVGLNILPPLQPGGRHKSGKNNYFSFALYKEPQCFFVKEFRLQVIAIPLKATGCVTSTPHAYLSRVTHAIFLVVCTRLKIFELCCVLSFLKVSPSLFMIRGTLFDALFSTPFSTSHPTLAPSRMTTLSLLHPSASPSTATPQGGLCLGRLGGQSPLTIGGPYTRYVLEHDEMVDKLRIEYQTNMECAVKI